MPTNRRFLTIAFTTVLVGAMSTFAMTRLKKEIGRIANRFITRPRKASLTKLMDLPLEVLVEILVLLEWKDILRVRQTCQRLCDASLSRPVWLSLVQWYSATIQPRPFVPEKPLDLYTDRELEHLILRWQSGRAGRALTRPKERALSLPEDYLQSVHLLKGGRWLLFGTRDGTVKYHDLNALGEPSESVTLVPSHFDQDANTIALLSVDMDPDTEYMVFNLGTMTMRLPPFTTDDPDYPNAPRYARWVEISRVTPYWDENGQVKGLRAERLACFREEYLCVCDSFSLRGRHVAYSLRSYEPISREGDGQNIVIVDWTLADSTSLVYPRRFIWRRRVRWLALLPDDRLLCNNGRKILLFDLADAPMTTFIPTQQNQPSRQEPVACLPLFARCISQPYFVHDSIRFSVLTDEGVKGLIITHSIGVSETMNCVDLFSDEIISDSACVGYDRAVVCFSRPAEFCMLQYAWPDEHFSFQKNIIETQFWSHLLFDECSSRILIHGDIFEIKAILDLAVV